MPKPTKMIIDTDPGVDDAMAILYAAHDTSIELLGLTTVFGNVPVEKATRNALRLCDLADLEIPVAEGAAKPSVFAPLDPAEAARIHGAEGFGPVPPETPQRTPTEEDAADFMASMARRYPGEVTLCAIGPITNVAEALRRHADFVDNIAKIIFMGGAAYVPGNVTPYAEANTYQDPHALAEVLASGVPTLMVGLDVTMQTTGSRDDFAELARRHPDHGGFLERASDAYIGIYEARGLTGCGLHDPAAVIACVKPDLFEITQEPLSVVLDGEQVGRTLPGHGSEAQICRGVDAPKLKKRFFSMFG
ncbi:nucleoside hydrolase [Tateyamaria sp. ANG-S1]|uniref:nucleoside hydrolase n=1 Tax=Tateyamaria sp. ANG-S1 TaxID=1577905 RepID=UPI00057CCC71|nr:nucleoside hydrolase [Tateyamaria sp. ANG-S1]KIC50062.1 nucleoside hydrolase [Tateyamaria sp. ANG-S1]